MTEQIIIQDNGDGTGTITIAGVPIVPYAAPIDPPSDPAPPAPIAKCSITQVDSRVAVWDKSTGFPPETKGTLDWGDKSDPAAIIAGQTGSVGHTYADGTYTITGKYTVAGVDYVDTVNVTVPKAAAPSAPPPATNPPPVSPPPPSQTSSTSKDIPAVVADGQSILYHYPTDIAFNDAVDWTDIPGEFGGPATRVQKIAWNFGDGTNGWGANGRHPYDKPGTYTITGSVSMKDGTITPFGPLTVTVGA